MMLSFLKVQLQYLNQVQIVWSLTIMKQMTGSVAQLLCL